MGPWRRRSSIGNVNPAVLPVPAWAGAITSQLLSTGGIDCTWIGP